jgi:ketosteroid isomerase-like protein
MAGLFPEESAMQTSNSTLIDLETRFWQSIVDQDTDTALEMLTEPALMVSSHGAMKFDHAAYRRMAEQGPMVLKNYELSKMEVTFPNDSTAVLTYHARQEMAPRGKDQTTVQEMNDTSTWIKTGDSWKCVMHTESPAEGARAEH